MTETQTNDPARASGQESSRDYDGDGITREPILAVLDEIANLNARKRADYASNKDIFSNFKEAAFFSGLRSPGQSVEALLGTKAARLRQLLWHRSPNTTPNNESIRDTLIDRAVYSVIAVAMYDQGLYENKDG